MRLPSSRRKKRAEERLDLVPIMDSIFIFIFFLLMSAQFLAVMEIGSPVPIVSDAEPPKNQKDPLALQLSIKQDELVLTKGLSQHLVARIPRLTDGNYDLPKLHEILVSIKKDHVDDEDIIFQPEWDLTYDEIVRIMDTVRLLDKTDEAIFHKGKDGVDEKVKTLFAQIVFGNLVS